MSLRSRSPRFGFAATKSSEQRNAAPSRAVAALTSTFAEQSMCFKQNPVSAFDFEKRLELLFSGFGRAYGLSYSILVPQSLVCEMMKFYDRSFEWDAAVEMNDTILSNDKKLVEVSIGNPWHAVVAVNLVRADVHKTVHWEVTLRKLPSYKKRDPENIRLMIGYVSEEARGCFRDNFRRANFPLCRHGHGERALLLRWGPRFFKYPYDSGVKRFYGDYGTHFRAGDRVELRFDFESRCCDAYYNGQRVGQITNQLPDALYPAMSFNAAPQSVETTKWEVV